MGGEERGRGSGGSGSGSGRASTNAAPARDPPSSEKWYFSREQLSSSPSRHCGLDHEKELAYRQQAANLIQDMGQRLQVSQLCINTAIVYMHRFYAFHSFTQFHRNSMAAAALFLAAKVEEQPRKLEHVIKVAHICLHRGEGQPTLDTQSKLYIEQTQDLVFNENVLLQTLGFDVAIDHPHTHVVHACDLIKASKDLAQTSYFMASNSLHLTTMCLQYRPTVVACFCIHLASKWSNWAIPQSNEGKHWFYYVDRTVTSELLEHLTTEFLHIFDRCPARLKKKMMSISNSQGTNSPQQPGTSHNSSNSTVPSSPFDKEPRKITAEELEKLEYDKRQLGLFGPSMPSNSLAPPTSNKIDYREYKERQPHQQDRRRPPNLPPSSSMPRPQEISNNTQPRPPSSSSGSQRVSQNIPSQHRWPSNQRSKDPNQSMRSHPSQSSSRPHHRSSSSVLAPQIPPQPQSLPTLSEPRSQSRTQLPIQQAPPQHPTRIHSQPQLPLQQTMQPQIQIQPPSHQPPPPAYQQPIQQPTHRPPSLFSPEHPRKQSIPRRPPMPLPSTKDLIPAPLSPFSSSPPSISQLHSELEANLFKKDPVPVEPQPLPSFPPNSTETDTSLLSLSHRADKKKKKEKHKHKDRDKRDERRKHKKNKDKRRDSESNNNPVSITPSAVPSQNLQGQSSIPLKITIPKDAYVNTATPPPPPPAILKIKIPKDRLKAEPPAPTPTNAPSQGLKIKIPKELVEGSRKRPPDPMPLETLPHKAPRLPQHPHQHKVSHQQQFLQHTNPGFHAPSHPLIMYNPYTPPPVLMYPSHPQFFYPPASMYSHPPPVATAPPLPPLPPSPPPPPPP